MAVFVDLDEDAEPASNLSHHMLDQKARPETKALVLDQSRSITEQKQQEGQENGHDGNGVVTGARDGETLQMNGTENSGDLSQKGPDNVENGLTRAIRCYPIATAIASSLSLNSLHYLARTCHGARSALLQFRDALIAVALRCENHALAVNPEDTFRFRARAGNLFYMEELSRIGEKYNGKSGDCARDMVDECRRCGRVVCRNCAIKPPTQIVLRDRHRRLCIPCTKAPLGTLVKPPLRADTSIHSDSMKRAICNCQSEGVWLCQPCGRSIRGADHEYQALWRWRNQYGEVLGGLGTGIGEGNRGVICGRDAACTAAKCHEQDTDCDADDARELVENHPAAAPPSPPWENPAPAAGTPLASPSPMYPLTATAASASLSSPSSHTQHPGSGGGNGCFAPLLPGENGGASRRDTPSPGYARHEVEGIGGVVKKVKRRMIRVGACVPEWEDEKNRGEILGRELSGRARSWCGWCWRVIPGKADLEGAGGGGDGGGGGGGGAAAAAAASRG